MRHYSYNSGAIQEVKKEANYLKQCYCRHFC